MVLRDHHGELRGFSSLVTKRCQTPTRRTRRYSKKPRQTWRGSITGYHHAMHVTTVTVVVGDWAMKGAPVVPHRD